MVSVLCTRTTMSSRSERMKCFRKKTSSETKYLTPIKYRTEAIFYLLKTNPSRFQTEKDKKNVKLSRTVQYFRKRLH